MVHPPGIGEDATLFFTVTETGAGLITGAELQVSGGTGMFDDEETQVPPGQLDLIATDNLLHTELFGTPETSIRVSDDIELFAGASISSIDKRFDQLSIVFPPLPEPGTLSILGSALLLLVALGWRRRDLLRAS